MKKQKMIGLMLATAMTASALAGCGSAKQETTAAAAEAVKETTKAAVAQTTAAPETEAALPRKLVIGIKSDSLITDYEDNYLTKLLEETLDCELEMMLLPSDEAELNTKLGLMVTSPEQLPDVLIAPLGNDVIYEYGKKGVFQDLTSYVNENDMPYFFEIQEEDRNHMIHSMKMADGKIYSLASYEPAEWNMSPYRMYINKVWLEKVGMEIPTTTDELYEVLKAFVAQDPNGNGVADEMAIYGNANGWGQNTMVALMNSFIYYNPQYMLALDDAGEKVIAPFTMDAYKDGLIYLNKLYEEGLVEPGFYTDDSNQVKAVLNNEDANLVGMISIGSHGTWTSTATNKNFLEMEMMPPLAGPKGVAYTPYVILDPKQTFFVTSKCENVDLAIELADLFYESDVSITARYGEKGVDWTDDPAVCDEYTHATIVLGVNDSVDIAIYNNIWPNQSDKYWKNINPRYAPKGFLGVTTIEDNLKANFKTNPATQTTPDNLKYYYGKWPENILPNLKFTEEEIERSSEPNALVTSYVKQSMAEFITGVRDVEKDWDAYLKEMEMIGLQEWIDCAQAAYDRSK